MTILERIKEECHKNYFCVSCKLYDVCIFSKQQLANATKERFEEIEKRLSDGH